MSKDNLTSMGKRMKRKKRVVESFCLTFSSRKKFQRALLPAYFIASLVMSGELFVTRDCVTRQFCVTQWPLLVILGSMCSTWCTVCVCGTQVDVCMIAWQYAGGETCQREEAGASFLTLRNVEPGSNQFTWLTHDWMKWGPQLAICKVGKNIKWGN